jgi:PKD repeat protein
VTFDATGSSDDGGIVNWTWTFTDGGIPVNLWEENVTYAFIDDFQTIDVTLTVRDGEGNSDSDTVTLEIVGLIPEFRTILAPVVVAIMAGVLVGFERRLKS